MLTFLKFILDTIFRIGRSKKSLLIENALMRKELEILKRTQQRRKLKIYTSDKIILSLLSLIENIKDKLTIVKPETLIRWQNIIIKKQWTFKHTYKKPGRPKVSSEIKELIPKIKNDNILWGIKKIQGELIKLDITLDTKTIRNILKIFRNHGKIKKALSWRNFIEMQAKSIYAMDFFTIDTILNQRFYVFFIIHHQTRKIVQFAVIQNPAREFVRQQIMIFSERLTSIIYLIRDNASIFNLDYKSFNIKEVRTAVEAPKMNAFAERVVRSVRTEALDYYLIFCESQIKNILTEYFEYYNNKRPHQGIKQNIPNGYVNQKAGAVVTFPVLSGLHHHYERSLA